MVEHSRPVCCEGYSKRWGIKIGVQFCFSGIRRYIKFFWSLFSLIRRIQGVEHSYDRIEVFSDSDPFDSDSWKMFRNNYIDVLFTNGQSFDFDPCELEPYEDPEKRRELRLNESILDDITDRTSVDVRDAQTDVNRDEYYEHQLKVIIASANQFSGKSFNLEQRRRLLEDILDYWEPQIYGHGEIHFNPLKGHEQFCFYMSDSAEFRTPAQMERFLKSMLSVCGPDGIRRDRRLYILEWDDDFHDYRYVSTREYTDYESWCNFNSHYPYKTFEDLYKIFVPLGDLFGLAADRVKKYVRDKFEFDAFGHSNPDYKGVRYGNILDRED